MPKIIIADDHGVVRTGLRTLLLAESDMELVGEARGGYEAIECVAEEKPDVLLLDISMPDLDGIEVTREIKKHQPETRILILTIHEDQALLQEVLKAGASGYVLKRSAESELISAIKIIMRGDMYIDPSMARGLFSTSEDSTKKPNELVEPLTPREKEVLEHIVVGYTNKQIAEEFNISIRTVEGHRANLTSKLGLKSRVDLVRYARDHGLIT